MLTAMDTKATVEFSLPEDSTEPRTVFHLGYFDTLLRAHLERKHLMAEQADNVGFLLDVVRFGLKRWGNLKDSEGKELPFRAEVVNLPGVGNRSGATDETLNLLRLEWITAIGSELVRMNFITAAAAKN